MPFRLPIFRAAFLVAMLLAASGLTGQIRVAFKDLARTQVQWLAVTSDDFRPGPAPDTLYLTNRPGSSLETYLVDVRQRLVNLPVFTDAAWEIVPTATDTLIQWTVEESQTIFPIISFGGVRGNTYYQVGFNDIHFRGRGQHLTGFYQNNDGEHNGQLLLRNESLNGSPWGYQVEVRRYAILEPLFFPGATVQYRYANLSFATEGTYRLRPVQILSLGLTTFEERYRKGPNEPLNSPGPTAVSERKFLLKTTHTLNHLNYFRERIAGSHHQSIAQAVITENQPGTFLIAWHDFRHYRLLGKLGNLAGRLRLGLATNNNSPFAPFVLDSQFNIRGSGNRVDRGTAQIVLNLEYRHTLWHDRRDRFALQIVGFSDFGTWRKPGGELSDLFAVSGMRHFLGGGLRLISLKGHDAVLRLDYGADVRKPSERGLVAGFGQYF